MQDSQIVDTSVTITSADLRDKSGVIVLQPPVDTTDGDGYYNVTFMVSDFINDPIPITFRYHLTNASLPKPNSDIWVSQHVNFTFTSDMLWNRVPNPGDYQNRNRSVMYLSWTNNVLMYKKNVGTEEWTVMTPGERGEANSWWVNHEQLHIKMWGG